MIYEWDEAKRIANMVKHGLDFEAARRFDWSTALQSVDAKRDYGEIRWKSLGWIDNRLHMLVFTNRGNHIHLISPRKANTREQAFYETQIDP